MRGQHPMQGRITKRVPCGRLSPAAALFLSVHAPVAYCSPSNWYLLFGNFVSHELDTVLVTCQTHAIYAR